MQQSKVYPGYILDYIHRQQLMIVILLKINNYVPSSIETVLRHVQGLCNSGTWVSKLFHLEITIKGCVYVQIPSRQLRFTIIMVEHERGLNPIIASINR